MSLKTKLRFKENYRARGQLQAILPASLTCRYQKETPHCPTVISTVNTLGCSKSSLSGSASAFKQNNSIKNQLLSQFCPDRCQIPDSHSGRRIAIAQQRTLQHWLNAAHINGLCSFIQSAFD